MKELQYSIKIDASREKVWNTLWQDETFRIWASVIDPETYMVGELKEGNEIQFISAANGYGVTSLVEKLIDGEYLLLQHQADTQNTGKDEREKQWTGGTESYKLVEEGGTTTLIAGCDVPPEMEEYFNETYPKAIEKIKELAEKE